MWHKYRLFKSSTKIFILGEFPPPKLLFLRFYHMVVWLFFGKIGFRWHQNDRFCTIKTIVLQHKTIAFAMQNDRNCLAKRPLLQSHSCRFSAHSRLSPAQLARCQPFTAAHSYVPKNRPRNLFFVFLPLSEHLTRQILWHCLRRKPWKAVDNDRIWLSYFFDFFTRCCDRQK